MAAAAKKTRKELLKEPDEFITLSSRMLGFMAANKKTIGYVCFGVLLVIVLFSGYIAYSGWQESQAAAQLAQALAKYERLRAESSQGPAVQAVAEDFKRILNDYGSRSNGAIARVHFANLCYETGDYQQAAALYQESLARFDGDPLMRVLLLKSLGYAHEGLKDYAAAAGYFEQALAAAQKDLQDDVLFHLGDLYARQGESQKSTAAFNRLLSEHQDSIYANLARERLNS